MTTHYEDEQAQGCIEHDHHDQDPENSNKDGEDTADSQCGGGICGFINRNRVTTILGFAIIGVALGIGLSIWEPENAEAKDITIKWIGLIGDLFLRALRCFVLPLVFVNIIIAVVDMMSVGKASTIGWTVIALFLGTTVMASIFGCISTLVFMQLYETETFEQPSPPYIQLGCSNPGSLLAELDDGSLQCSANFTKDSPNVNFIIEDISKTFVTKSSGTTELSLSDTIYQGIFQKTVPDNIISAFDTSNFVAIIFFAILFGVALHRVIFRTKGKDSFLMGVLHESDSVFQLILLWIIFLTPFAVCSLIATAIGNQDDLGTLFKNIGYLVGASMLAWALQFIFVYFGFYYFMTGRNPFAYHAKLLPAQTMAFASASSAATIPTSLLCLKSTGLVPDTIARFVIPFGATVNMDGGAIYFVCSCVWMAVLNGEDVTAASFILLIIIATLGSIGTAPVPSASLVLIITAYNTVFGGTGTPNGFAYIFAIDWFMDRCRTVLNVTGDLVASGIVAHRCPIDDTIEATTKDEVIADEPSKYDL